jgi:hypothetical protein
MGGGSMNVVTYEAVVHNGHVELPADVILPEEATVYVVVPAPSVRRTAYFRSPRLADPAQAARLELEVIEEGKDAGL